MAMGGMGGATAALGAGFRIAGGILEGNAADQARKRLEAVANTPGLDLDSITAERLSGIEQLFPQAQALTSREATARQSLINQLIEQSMPGFAAARDQGTAAATDLIAGRVPSDVSDLVQRSSAARALGGGFAGSGMHRNLVGRDLGLTSIGLKSQGLQWLQALRGMSPAIAPQSAFAFTGPSPNEAVSIRGHERDQKMQLLANLAVMPGKTGVWGRHLMESGAMLAGMGMGDMGGGGGGGDRFAPYSTIRVPSGSRYQGSDWSDEFL